MCQTASGTNGQSEPDFNAIKLDIVMGKTLVVEIEHFYKMARHYLSKIVDVQCLTLQANFYFIDLYL